MRECSKRQNVIYAVVLGIMLLFCLSTMHYTDNMINSDIGYRLISSVFEGKFSEFYNSMDWSYGMTIYFIYAVWSIPVWVISHIVNIQADMMSIPILLWYKLMLVAFAVASVWIVGKIAEETYKEYKKDVQFQYMSSVLFVFPILAVAQCDIIGLCFVLLGIYYYIQEKNIKFLICFALAITMKYFAIFAFVPLILFKNRKISKMFSVLVAGLGLMLISAIFISNSDAGNAMMHNEDYYVNQHILAFSKVALPIDESKSIGLFGLFYMVLCIIAYIVPNHNKEKNKQYIIWLAFAGYMCLFLFYPCNFYWYVLLAPFMIMLSYFRKENIKINLLIEAVFGLLILVYYSYIQNWVILGSGTYKYLLLRDFGQAVEYNSMMYFFEKLFHMDLELYMPLIVGIIYACAIAMLVINFPGVQVWKEEQSEAEIFDEIKVVTWLRLGILGAIIMISVYCLYASQKEFYIRDSANIQIIEEEIYEERCELQGDLFLMDDGAWMNEECTITFNIEKDCNQDIKLSVYGYTLTGEDTVEVYVNSQYVGDLQKEDASANITNRYIVIPNAIFSKEAVEQAIILKAKPQMRTVGDIVENSVVIGKEERPISIYIQSINLEMMK